jgi:hypothetical protein
MTDHPFRLDRLRLVLRALTALTLFALLVSCGGGGGVGSEGTGTFGYSKGPISGFGSIIVNGVRFDDSGARIEDEDGARLGRDALKLGMTVQVDSGEITVAAGGAVAVASQVRVVSAVRGPVSAVDAVAGTLTVLGQTVRTTAGTVFDDALALGLADVAVGDVVEVYGAQDTASGTTTAERIEPARAGDSYQVRGAVAAINATAQTLRVGGLSFSTARTAPPADLAVGDLVRLVLDTARDDAGRYVVTRYDDGVRVPADDTETEIEGGVTAFTSATRFSVDGVPVDAGGAAVTPAGATVTLGARVEVEGTMSGGVLVATRVKIDDEADDAEEEREVSGPIDSVDTGARSFVVRGVTVVWDDDTRFDDGTAADLVVDAEVEVDGVLTDNGTRLKATRIKFDD